MEDDLSKHRMWLQRPRRRAQKLACRRRRKNDDLRRPGREVIRKPDRDLVIGSDRNALLVGTHDDLAILPYKGALVTLCRTPLALPLEHTASLPMVATQARASHRIDCRGLVLGDHMEGT